MDEERISNRFIGKAIEVHKILGTGLLKSAYQKCLFYELINEELKIEQEKALPIYL